MAEFCLRFVGRCLTTGDGSTWFDDLSGLLMHLTLLLIGIAIVYGLFKRSAPKADPLPLTPVAPTTNLNTIDEMKECSKCNVIGLAFAIEQHRLCMIAAT